MADIEGWFAKGVRTARGAVGSGGGGGGVGRVGSRVMR